MRHVMIAATVRLIALSMISGCGHPDDRNLRSGPDSRAAAHDEAGDYNIIDSATVDLRAVTLIRINKPYCRDGVPETKAPTLCTGTVIDDRFLITAAHCFVSECPTNKLIAHGDILVPKGPRNDLSTFDWSNRDEVLPAKNIRIPFTFTGIYYRSTTNTAATAGSPDIAIVDFGIPDGASGTDKTGNLKLSGYPSIAYRHPLKSLRNEAYPFDYDQTKVYNSVGYATTTGSQLIRAARNDMKYYFTTSYSDSTLTHKWLTFARDNTPIGCAGDSGSPIIADGTVAGIVSAVGEDMGLPLNPFPSSSASFNCDWGQKGILATNKPQKSVHVYMIPLKYVPDYSTAPTSAKLSIDPIMNAINSMKENYPSPSPSPSTSTSTSTSTSKFKIDLDLRKVVMGSTTYDNSSYFRATYMASHALSASTANTWAALKDGVYALRSALAGGSIDAAKSVGNGTTTATWTATGLAQGYYKAEVFYQANSLNSACTAIQFQTYKEGTWSGTAPNYVWTPTSWKTLKNRVNQKTGTASGAAPTVQGWTPVYKNVTPMISGGTNSSTYIFVSNDRNNQVNSGRLSIRMADVPQTGCANERLVADVVRLTLIQSILTAPTTFNSNL